MEKSNSEKIRLGVFVTIGLLIFVVAIYFIGEKQKLFGNTEHLKAVFKNVNGLQIGNNVRYSGINIGTVRAIDMTNDTTITIDMILDKKIFSHIKQDAVATIGSDGLVGNMIVNILPGSGNKPSVKPNDVIASFSRKSTDNMLNTLSVTNDNAALLTADLLKITKEIIHGKGSIGLLVNDTVMSGDLKQTLYYLKETSKGASETVLKLNKLIASLDNNNNVIGVLKDTAVASQIKHIASSLDKTVADLNATILNIKDGKGAINYLSNDSKLVAQIDNIVTNLNETMTNINHGKGAVGYLINDPRLAKQIDSTMTNINDASFRLNEDLEALKHNILLRRYFKKQEKAKQKAAEKKN